MAAQILHGVDQAIKKLRSFHDGDLGVIDVIAWLPKSDIPVTPISA
jgi:hypothetical protein